MRNNYNKGLNSVTDLSIVDFIYNESYKQIIILIIKVMTVNIFVEYCEFKNHILII